MNAEKTRCAAPAMDAADPSKTDAVSVLLADPSPILREKIAGILLRLDRILCVVQVSKPEQTMRVAGDHQPDVILADLAVLKDPEFVKALRACSRCSRIVAMVEILSEPYTKAARWLAVDGVIEKSNIAESIQHEILKAPRES